MKKNKKLLMFFMTCTLALTTCLVNLQAVKAEATAATDQSIKAMPNPKTVSQNYAEAMEPGWNLGNTFDSCGTSSSDDKGEQSWGNPVVTKEFIDSLKAQGFKSIRMPLTLFTRIGSAPDYKIDPKFLTRYAEVVKWAVDDGLYVMVNIHHDSWSWVKDIDAKNDNGASMAKYKALWTQLADYFKDYSDKVCFESINEPGFKESDGKEADNKTQMERLADVNTQFYNIVRNSGGNNSTRMLILPMVYTSADKDRCESLYNTIIGLKDPNIIATFHFYGYWPFSVNIAGTTTMDKTVVDNTKQAFDTIYNQFVANGIGAVCGEYGLLAYDKSSNASAIEHGELLKYFEHVNYYAKARGITMMLWDNGQHFNRRTYKWNDQSLYNMISASWGSRSSYTESDRMFIKDEDKGKDVTLKLILNGNTFKSIYNGTTMLTEGSDYTYQSDAIILKGDYVKGLIKDSYGTSATLTVKFSAGADWNVDLIRYATPALSSTVGDANGFAIPVQFNGSKLSTLETMYEGVASSPYPGPASWTTYQGYNDAFKVDYSANTVTMTKKFIDSTHDGIIIIKLHFQSGEVIEYKIDKEGTTVKSVN